MIIGVDFFMKQGDTLPSIGATLFDDAGNPLNLSAATVAFSMADQDSGIVASGPAVVVDGPGGKVRYDWQVGDTDVPGVFRAEWIVTFGGDLNIQVRVPNDSFHVVKITKNTQGA